MDSGTDRQGKATESQASSPLRSPSLLLVSLSPLSAPISQFSSNRTPLFPPPAGAGTSQVPQLPSLTEVVLRRPAALTLMVTFPLVILRMLKPTVGIMSSLNCPDWREEPALKQMQTLLGPRCALPGGPEQEVAIHIWSSMGKRPIVLRQPQGLSV